MTECIFCQIFHGAVAPANDNEFLELTEAESEALWFDLVEETNADMASFGYHLVLTPLADGGSHWLAVPKDGVG